MKDIVGFEGLYAITKDGRVWSYPKKNGTSPRAGRWLKQLDSKNGYKRVCLTMNYKQNWRYIHRLMALNFLEPIDGKKIVNHKDGNKSNNMIGNIIWSNHRENLEHAYRTGLNKHPTLKSKEQVDEIIRIYENREMVQTEIAKKFNISQALVSKITRKESYTWL